MLRSDRPINRICVGDDMLMEMNVGNGWTVTDVQWDHDVPVKKIDCVKVKFEKMKTGADQCAERVETMSCQECRHWKERKDVAVKDCERLLTNQPCEYEPDCQWK